jgi:hypothetical protein
MTRLLRAILVEWTPLGKATACEVARHARLPVRQWRRTGLHQDAPLPPFLARMTIEPLMPDPDQHSDYAI